MSQRRQPLFAAAGVILVLLIAAFIIFYGKKNPETGGQASLRNDYDRLFAEFSVEHPGRGTLDYPENISADYAKSYAMFLSADLIRARSESSFELSPAAKNAGYWLLDHADEDQDGVIGWGLPVAWDAYGDGTLNPPNAVYTITTAIAINGLLDWLEVDPNAPADRIVSTVGAAFQPFLEPEAKTPEGLLLYSLSANDRPYVTYNPAAYMAGQMQRFSASTSDPEEQRRLRAVADQTMIALLDARLVDQRGGWYWLYGVGESSPNDAAHAIYIVDGIYQYIAHQGKFADEFDWSNIVKHIDLFYSSSNERWMRFPQLSPDSPQDPPRLYEIGMLLRFMAMAGKHEEGLSLYQYSLDYRTPDGLYAKFPVSASDGEQPLVINEYMSYLLYGWSSLLFQPPLIGLSEPSNVAENDPAVDEAPPVTDLKQPILVPFTFLDVEDYDIQLEFDVNQMAGNLLVNEKKFSLPEQTLPLKIIEWDPQTLVVFTRRLWSNQTQIWSLDLTTGENRELLLPADTSLLMFRQAVLYQHHIVFILFDPIKKTNFLYRLLPGKEAGQALQFDRSFQEEYYIDQRYGYRQQPHILAVEFQERLYLASDSVVYEYRYLPGRETAASLTNFSLSNQFNALEIAADQTGIFALYRNVDYSAAQPQTEQNFPFVLYDLATQTVAQTDFNGFVPYGLTVEDGKPRVQLLETPEDLQEVFLIDMRNMPASGMMSAGVNNLEGEVIWTQSYYLNAFVDFLEENSDPRTLFPLSDLKPQIKRRLDFEMALIDRLMIEGSGLLCKAFTVDRTPVLHAVQTGKMLLLMKRYQSLPNSLPLESYPKFRKQVMGLEGHIEVLAQADPSDRWLDEDKYYLMWPKGSPFWADGAGIPYNHQNMWAAGLLYNDQQSKFPPKTRQAVMDIPQQVLDLEGFSGFPAKHGVWNSKSPEYFEWYYWWGWGKAGWKKSDAISVNTPHWAGDGNNVAIPVYRTFDAMAVLIAGEHSPGILPGGIVEYYRRGVEMDGLELFLSPYLARYGKMPEVSSELAGKYLRFAGQPDLRDSLWAYRYMFDQMNTPASVTQAEPPRVAQVGLYVLDILLVLGGAIVLSAIWKVDKPIPWLMGIFLIGYAMIVVTVEVGGLLSLLNSTAYFIVFHLLILFALIAIWSRSAAYPRLILFQASLPERSAFLSSLKAHWEIWIFAAICAAGFAFLGYSNLILPQKIDDVVTAHLARVGYWLQHGNLRPWPADTYQLAQVIYPLNAQSQILWSLLFLRSDQLAGISQWIALPIVFLAVYGFARLLQLDRYWSVIAALVCFSIPNVYLQGLTAMTDLVSAALFLCAVYLFFLMLREERLSILSGVALGLAVGTKQTILFALPGLFLILAYLAITRKSLWSLLLKWTGVSLAAFLLAGAYIYISNFVYWGSPLGPDVTYQGFTQRGAALSLIEYLDRFLANGAALLGVLFKVDLMGWNFDGTVWPGPALFALILCSLLYVGSRVRSREMDLTAYSLMALAVSNALILLLVRDFTGSLSRYLMISMILFVPLGIAGLARIAEEMKSQRRSNPPV